MFIQNAHASTLTSPWPDPRGHVRYYHHIASSVVCNSLTLTLEGCRRGVYSVPSYGLLFRSEFFFRTTQELEYLFFFCRSKRENFFQNVTLGYMTKTRIRLFFFSSTKIRIFFSATLGIRIFFLEKKQTPPTPFKLNGRSLNNYLYKII
jgi:hypothetical protein